MVKITSSFLVCIAGLSILLSTPGCHRELDEDGGYFDEKTQTYKYVKPRAHRSGDSASLVSSPRPGETQMIEGKIARIEPDAKTIWLQMAERKPYMIIAEALSGRNREDKNKELRISLSHISPMGSVARDANFRAQWIDYVRQVLARELIGQKVLVEVQYLEAARKLVGTVYMNLQTQEGQRTRNINLWMIGQGLTYYFVDAGPAVRDEDYRKTQDAARRLKLGLWQYQ
jgi:hypothetical protein